MAKRRRCENTDRNGTKLRVGDRVRIPLREDGVKLHAHEGFPPRGTIVRFVGCSVAEVRATTRGGKSANWERGGLYDVGGSSMIRIGRARKPARKRKR